MAEEYWYVIYKAVGDFGDLIKDAAAAKAAMDALSKSVKDDGVAQQAASTQAVLARQKELTVLSQETKGYETLSDAARQALVWTDFGGRNTMAQHLSDLSQELQWETLLNRQRWLGFSSPQAAYSWKQLELYQAWLMNRAKFGATSSGTGYTTPDQYLSYLQKEYAALSNESTVLRARAGIYQDMADAYLAYARALQSNPALTVGTVGEPGIQQIAAGLAGLPGEVTTTVQIDDAGALAKLATYAALLRGLPTVETTVLTENEVLKAAYAAGGVPVPGALPPGGEEETIQVRFEPTYFAEVLGEVAELRAQKVDIPVSFDLDPASLAVLEHLPVGGDVINISEHVSESGAVGAGPGPPLSELADETAAIKELAAATDDLQDIQEAEIVTEDEQADSASSLGKELVLLTAAQQGASDSAHDSEDAWAGASDAQDDAGLTAEALAGHLLNLAAHEEDAGKAAYTTLAALKLLQAAQGDAADGAASVADETAKVSSGVKNFGNVLGALAGGLLDVGYGWAFLNTKIAVFGGLLGAVAVWHIILDTIIEFLAVLVPVTVALLAGAAAFGIFLAVATQAADTLGRVNDRAHAVYTATTALNQNIYPLTNSFDKLQTVIRPEVWELLGDGINLVSSNTGVLGKIAEAVGAVLDRFAAQIVEDLPGIEHALSDMARVGAADLQRLGVIFGNLGSALLSFVKVTQVTHIAEYLLDFAEAATKLIAIIGDLPVPLLAVALGLHAIYLWGGLLVTGVVALLDPLRALALTLGGVSAAETALQNLPEDASALDKLKATISDIAMGFGALPGRIGGTTSALQQVALATGQSTAALVSLQANAAKAGVTIESLVTGSAAADVKTFGAGLDQAGVDALNLASAAGASQAQLGRLAVSLGATSDEAKIAAAGTVELDAAMTDTAAASGVAATATRGFGAALLGLVSNPLAWLGVAIAALAVVTVEIIRAKDATQQWIQSMDTALDKTSVYKGIGQTVQDLAAVTQELSEVQHGAAGNASELGAAQDDLSAKLGQELIHVGDISRAYGTTFVGALALLNASQVTTAQLATSSNKVWQEAQIQVAGLVTGYKAMAIGLGEVQNAVTIQLVANAATAPALGAMQKLNGYYDDFLQLSTALAGAFVTTGQGAATFATDIAAAGASMAGLNAASLTAQSDAQALLSDIEQQLDAYRNAVAVSGTGNITAYIKDMVAELIQAGPHTQAFLAQVTQIADEGGYNGATGSLQALAKWVGNISSPMDAAQAATNKEVIAVSNLSADAKLLSSTLEGDLNPAMANATFNALGGQKVFSTFADALLKFGPNSKVTVDAGKAVAQELLSVDKNSATAKTQFTGWAETMGLSKTKANELWAEVSKGEKPMETLRKNLGAAQTAGTDLADNGFWAQLRDNLLIPSKGNSAFDYMYRFIKDTLIPAFSQFGDAFGRDVIKPMVMFFTQTVPSWVGPFIAFWQGVGRDIQSIWAMAWSALVSPVIKAFDDVKKAITGGFDGWWKTHGDEVKQVWQYVTGSFSQFWSEAVADLEATWDQFVGWFSSAGNIAKPLKAAFDVLPAQLQPIIAALTGTFAGLWAGLETTAKVAWNVVGAAAKVVWDVIGNLVVAAAKIAAGAVVTLFQNAWDLVEGVAKAVWDAIVGIINVALDLITGHWGKAWADMQSAAGQVWNALSSAVTASWDTLMDFFRQTWDTIWGTLKTTAEQAWNALYQAGSSSISDLWRYFNGFFISPLETFFRSTVPSLFSSLVDTARNSWHTIWSWFSSDIVTPIGRFFSGVPTTIDNAFHSAINTVVGLINDVLGFFHLPTVHLAAGGGVGINSAGGVSSPLAMLGSVPGNGDSDSHLAAVMPGEYVLRKPARMALQAIFGPDVLTLLNGADRWLGGGSRGILASQQGPGAVAHYQGGGIIGWVEGLGKNALNFIENPVGEVEHIWGNITTAALGELNFGIVAEVVKAVAKEAESAIETSASAAAKSVGQEGGGGPVGAVSGDAKAWIEWALAITGTSMSWLPGMERLVGFESGGNAHAYNPQVAGLSGEHAEGVAQTIPSTFAEYIDGYTRFGDSPYDPIADLIASIRYIKAVYGTVYNIPGISGGSYGGYATGGGVADAGAVTAAWAAQLADLERQYAAEETAYGNLYKAATGGRPSAAQWREAEALHLLQQHMGEAWSSLMAGGAPAMTAGKWENFLVNARDSYYMVSRGKQLPLLGKAYPGRSSSLSYWLGRLTNQEPLAYSAWGAYEKTIAAQMADYAADWNALQVNQKQLTADVGGFEKVLGATKLNTWERTESTALSHQWALQNALFAALSGAGSSSPVNITPGDWSGLESRDAAWDLMMTTYQATTPDNRAALKALAAKTTRYGDIERDLSAQGTLLKRVYPIWASLYGPNGVAGAPGPGGSPGGGTPGAGPGGPITVTPGPAVNVMPAATMGGPSSPVFNVGPGGASYGFAGGGTVHPYAAGGPVMLTPAEALSLFTAGLNPVGPMMPGAAGSSLNMASGVAAGQQRVLSDAAAAARRVGVENMSIVVNNPSPAAAEPSIAHAVNRASFLAGRAVA